MTSELRIPRPPDAVLFDMDGVLVDTFDAWVAVLDECRVRRGLAPVGAEAVRAVWGQGLLADCRTLFPGEDPDRLAADYDDGFARRLDLVRVTPGAGAAIAALQAAGIPLALVTNSPVSLARRILDRAALRSAFRVIAGGDEVRNGKPHPDLVLLALGRLGVRGGRVALVGDTTLDIDAARAAGVPAIGYRIAGDARVDDLGHLAALFGL